MVLPTTRSRYLPGRAFSELGDGSRGAVMRNRRVVLRGAEASLIDPAEVADLGRGHRIPAPLGGGFLFVGDHTLRFSPTFSGPLTEVASRPGAREMNVGVGYQQVLVRFGEESPALHSLPDGKALPIQPKNAVSLFGAPQGHVAATGSAGELWFSPGAGKPWRRLVAPKAQTLLYDGTGIVVFTEHGGLRLHASGKLELLKSAPDMTVAWNVDAFREPWPDLRAPPTEGPGERLLSPLTRSVSDALALAVSRRDLVFLDASSGAVRETLAGTLPNDNCTLVRGGTPSLVSCFDGSEHTIFSIDGPGKRLVPEHRYRPADFQFATASAPDAVAAFSGHCDGKADRKSFCVREASGKWVEHPPVVDPEGVVSDEMYLAHVVTARDGRVYGFGWSKRGGDLIIIDDRQRRVRRIPQSSIPQWASQGFTWQAASPSKEGVRILSGGSRGTVPGVIEIRDDGRIETQRFQGQLAASGPRALLATPDGGLRETLDGGRSFHDVKPPVGGAPLASELFFCHETGCNLGAWNRVGWGPAE